MRAMIDDVRFAYRALRARPGFVIAAVLTLALGIGANTAIFSVINAFMLEPLPYPDGERLVEIHNTYPGIGLDNAGSSIPDYLDRREQAEALEDLALFTWDSYNLAASGTPERLLGLVATPSLFSTLGVSPLLGRPFDKNEAVPGNDKAVVLTYNLWVNRFNADPGVVDLPPVLALSHARIGCGVLCWVADAGGGIARCHGGRCDAHPAPCHRGASGR